MESLELLKNAISHVMTQNPQSKVLKMSEEDREKLHFDIMLKIAKTDPVAFTLHQEGLREWLFHYFHLVAFDDEDE
jgi:hypothetical protein